MKEQLKVLLSAPHVQQHIFQITITLLLENGVDLEKNILVDPHFIKGLNAGVLLFTNELLKDVTNLA